MNGEEYGATQRDLWGARSSPCEIGLSFRLQYLRFSFSRRSSFSLMDNLPTTPQLKPIYHKSVRFSLSMLEVMAFFSVILAIFRSVYKMSRIILVIPDGPGRFSTNQNFR
jgi:hypothetical protein